jgi:hypothetical protein
VAQANIHDYTENVKYLKISWHKLHLKLCIPFFIFIMSGKSWLVLEMQKSVSRMASICDRFSRPFPLSKS